MFWNDGDRYKGDLKYDGIEGKGIFYYKKMLNAIEIDMKAKEKWKKISIYFIRIPQ